MKVLLLCTSHNDLGLIRALRKMGFSIIATGNVEKLPGQKYVDKYIKADYSDKQQIEEIARMEAIDRICPCCNDYGVYTAAYVAEKLGLPGFDPYDVTIRLHNKDLFKELALKMGILTPISHAFSNQATVISYLESCDYPVIIKPTDASAGHGIHRANDTEEACTYIREAFANSKVGRILIEPFLTGTQHGFCTYLIHQRVAAICSNNEYSFLNPYRVEIDTFPSTNWKVVSSFLVKEIEAIARALSLKDGIFHLQYIMHDGKPWILEVMRRVLGNMYSVPGNLLCGIDWDYWEARARCGFPVENFPADVFQEGFFAYKTILAPCNGRIKKIHIPENYHHYLLDEYLLRQEDDIITDYASQPIGFLFFQFASQAEMEKVLINEYRNDLVSMGNE